MPEDLQEDHILAIQRNSITVEEKIQIGNDLLRPIIIYWVYWVRKMDKREAKNKTLGLLGRAGIAITEEERHDLEIADLGLGRLPEIGLQVLTYVNEDRYCAKEIVLLPSQTCPEHRHPGTDSEPGKKETFRCRWGEVYLYLEGKSTKNPTCEPPGGNESYYTVWREVVLTPGYQFTIPPDTKHWFQAGSRGSIISEFSSHSRDEDDIFTNPNVERVQN